MANEKRLIDRNEIFPNGTFFASAEDPMKSLDELIKRIWSIPTVDAVEVVRCKGCKYFIPKVDGTVGFCKCGEVCGYLTTMRVADDFCSYGERRTDD